MLTVELGRARAKEPKAVKRGQSFYKEPYKPRQSPELYSLDSGQRARVLWKLIRYDQVCIGKDHFDYDMKIDGVGDQSWREEVIRRLLNLGKIKQPGLGKWHCGRRRGYIQEILRINIVSSCDSLGEKVLIGYGSINNAFILDPVSDSLLLT